jgi:hypothetical protein
MPKESIDRECRLDDLKLRQHPISFYRTETKLIKSIEAKKCLFFDQKLGNIHISVKVKNAVIAQRNFSTEKYWSFVIKRSRKCNI